MAQQDIKNEMDEVINQLEKRGVQYNQGDDIRFSKCLLLLITIYIILLYILIQYSDRGTYFYYELLIEPRPPTTSINIFMYI